MVIMLQYLLGRYAQSDGSQIDLLIWFDTWQYEEDARAARAPVQESTQSENDGSLVFLHNLEANAERKGQCDEDQPPWDHGQEPTAKAHAAVRLIRCNYRKLCFWQMSSRMIFNWCKAAPGQAALWPGSPRYHNSRLHYLPDPVLTRFRCCRSPLWAAEARWKSCLVRSWRRTSVRDAAWKATTTIRIRLSFSLKRGHWRSSRTTLALHESWASPRCVCVCNFGLVSLYRWRKSGPLLCSLGTIRKKSGSIARALTRRYDFEAFNQSQHGYCMTTKATRLAMEEFTRSTIVMMQPEFRRKPPPQKFCWPSSSW